MHVAAIEAMTKQLQADLEYSQGQTESALKIVSKYETELEKHKRDPKEWLYQVHLWAKTRDELLEKLDCLFGDELAKLRWIPTGERLPEDNQCVFVAMKHMKTCWGFLAWYSPVSTKSWEFYDPMVKGEITHWKPIILPGQAGQG